MTNLSLSIGGDLLKTFFTTNDGMFTVTSQLVLSARQWWTTFFANFLLWCQRSLLLWVGQTLSKISQASRLTINYRRRQSFWVLRTFTHASFDDASCWCFAHLMIVLKLSVCQMAEAKSITLLGLIIAHLFIEGKVEVSAGSSLLLTPSMFVLFLLPSYYCHFCCVVQCTMYKLLWSRAFGHLWYCWRR